MRENSPFCEFHKGVEIWYLVGYLLAKEEFLIKSEIGIFGWWFFCRPLELANLA